MLWKKKNGPSRVGSNLPFKNATAFIEYCNSQFPEDVRSGQARPGIIVDAVKEFGAPRSVSVDDEGYQTCSLYIAAPGGAFFVNSSTANPSGPPLEAGDLVVWAPFSYKGIGVSAATGDLRSDWIGFIVAKIAPEIDVPSGEFNILARYQ